jgi:hypothetical protein
MACLEGEAMREMMKFSDEEVASFERDGFVIVRNVFNQAEVRGFRDGAQRFTAESRAAGRILKRAVEETVPVGDILGRDGIGDVVFDDRMLTIARRLIGAQKIVYFGDSGVNIGRGPRGFHKDNTVRDDPSHPDWQQRYTLVRFGIYLEDHADYSGGLKVRRGSHNAVDVFTGRIVSLGTRPGDVVVWSLRTTHSGHSVRMRGLPWLPLQPRMEQRLPPFLRVPEQTERVAMFVTYGTDDEHLRRYIAKHTDLATYPENYLYKSWLHSHGEDSLAEMAASKGVEFRKPIADYGRLVDSMAGAELGYIPCLPPRPDVNKPRGVEAVIQRVGRALDAAGLRARR